MAKPHIAKGKSAIPGLENAHHLYPTASKYPGHKGGHLYFFAKPTTRAEFEALDREGIHHIVSFGPLPEGHISAWAKPGRTHKMLKFEGGFSNLGVDDRREVEGAIRESVKLIESEGEKVGICCENAAMRSPSLSLAILHSMGIPEEEALQYLKEHHDFELTGDLVSRISSTIPKPKRGRK
jgi:hypothetical protein